MTARVTASPKDFSTSAFSFFSTSAEISSGDHARPGSSTRTDSFPFPATG